MLRHLAAAALAALLPSLTFAADAPDLSDLRDAVATANARGANVADVSAALAALEKTLARGWTYPPPGVASVPPRDLVELRTAVETAARKGESVEGVVRELEALEKEMTGRVQQRPRPVPPPATGAAIVPPPVRPAANASAAAPKRPDPAALKLAQQAQWAEAQLQRAAEYRRQNPLDPDAVLRFSVAQEAAVKARAASGAPAPVAAPVPPRPEVRAAAPVNPVNPPQVRVIGKVVRLGLRFERVPPAEAERNGLANGAGLRVAGVADGSPAAVAEFRVGDVVVEFAGRPVTGTPADFSRLVAGLPAGGTTAVVARDGKRVELKVSTEVK